MPLSDISPVKKSNYRQKKPRIKQPKNQLNNSEAASQKAKNSQKRREELEQNLFRLQTQITHLRGLQEKSHTKERDIIIRQLVTEVGNTYSLLNSLAEREREREQQSRYCLNFQLRRKFPSKFSLCQIANPTRQLLWWVRKLSPLTNQTKLPSSLKISNRPKSLSEPFNLN